MKKRAGRKIISIILSVTFLMFPGNMLLPGYPHSVFAEENEDALQDGGATSTAISTSAEDTPSIYEVDPDSVPPFDTDEPGEQIPEDQTPEEATPEEVIPEEAPEEVLEEEVVEFESEPDPNEMAKGLEDRPDPLSLEDLIDDFGVQPPSMLQGRMMLFTAAVETNPVTIVIGDDNDNNAHTGVADGDIDYNISATKANYPVEISFNLDALPTESAYIAIKAYDVDEEAGEKDYVFINDAPMAPGIGTNSIGCLSGNNNTWNTTVLQIPLSKLKLGKNYISISITRGWWTTVDWAQLILDGGSADENVSDFSIKLGDAIQNGSQVEIAATVNITQDGSTEYHTEYMLTNVKGENLDSAFGTASSTETAMLNMPLSSPSGTYTVTGLIKGEDETIKASDTITFDFVSGEVPTFGPKISYRLQPATLTNGNVVIQLEAENMNPAEISDVEIWYQSGDITNSSNGTITSAYQSVSESGTYPFTIKFVRNGIERISGYNVKIDNIDKKKPVVLFAGNVNVLEETPDDQVLAAIAGNITVKDDISLPANPYTISPNSDLAAIPGEKTITVTARDTAGNEETKNLTVVVLPKPVQLAQNEPVMDGTSHTAALSAAIEYTGGLNITEYGFVWGVSQNPTPSVCNGIANIAGTLEKGETFNAAAADISEGINYYVRAYIKAGSEYYYSDQKSFNIGAPQYGNFSVSTEATLVSNNGGTAVFTISRPADRTEGTQTVSYRTVNGTAIGGIHFQHKLGTITFSDGEASKVIEVPVYGIAREYGSNPATAYQNTQRSFYLEIYKVQGGATINGTASVAKKAIDLDSTKEVDANAYNQYNSVNTANGAAYLITDDGSGTGSSWKPNAGATDSVSFTKVGNTDCTYLDKTADHYALKYDLTISEQDDGYELMQVTTQTAPYSFGHSNVNSAAGPELYYALAFEHDTSGTYGTAKTYTFPSTTARAQAVYSKSAVTGSSGTLTDGGTAVNIGKNKMVYVHYSASGGDNDKWYKSGFQPSVRAIDTAEPQLLAVAPMAGGTYSFGDTVYVSLIFNEIVDSLSGAVTLNTNLSETPFSYVEGEGTNVLVFKGTVNREGQSFSQLIITAVNGSENIKDMSVITGTPTAATGDSTELDANTVRPVISFAGSSTGTLPRHTAEIAITDAASACYTWSMNSEMPVSGWMDLPDATGGTMTETLTGGESGSAAVWYLHVLATHTNGNILWAVKEFNFQQPTLNATVSHPDQWLPGKEITLSVTGSAPVNVAMTGPETGNYTENTVITVATAGTYTFTLTDEYGSNIVKRLDVSRIDHTKPEIVIREYGDTAVKYTSLDFGASATDDEGGSGIASLEYAWAGSTAVPADWMPMSAEGGLIPTYNTVGTVYLHLKAVDNAGNTNYACSGAYTVMDNTPPQIDAEFLNDALEAWQSGNVSLRYVVTKTSGDIKSINAADQILENGDLPSSYPYEDTIEVDRNGMVFFMVSDENGLSDTASLVVNYLDNEAPSVSVGYGPGNTAASWAKTKTVILNANDSTSPVIDGSGAITTYSGSGVASLKWKKQGESSYHAVSDGSFTADENTTYFIKAADACGNSSEYTISISGIDTTAPNVSIGTPTDWQNANYSAAVNYGDDYSGIASAKYAVSLNNVSIPEELSDLPASGGSIVVTGQGSSYIYYIVTDKAGNTTEGWTEEIKLDKAVPALTVTPYCETEGGTAYVPGQWTSSDVVFKLGNSTSQISGTVYQVSIDDGPWNTLAGDTYIISANTNKNYRFRAVSGAGLSDTCSNIPVKIQKSMQDQEMEASMLSPSPNTEDSWYRNETIIRVDKPSAEDGGPVVTVNYKLWKEGEGEPLSASVLGGETIAIPADGIWTLKIWTEDEAGNSSEPLISHYYVDTTEPVIERVQYQLINDDGSYGELQSFNPDKNFFRQAVRITVKIGDILSGPAKISWLYDAGTPEELETDENGTATFDLGPDFDGSVVIGAIDKAGNAVIDEDKAVINLISEQHPPMITFNGAAVTEEPEDIWLQGAQTVEIMADDETDGEPASALDHMNIDVKRWDGTAYTESMDGISCSFEGLSEAAATTAKTHELILSASGRYEITVSAVDRAGNQAALQTRYISVDTDLPAGAPQLTLSGVEIDNDAYYQAKDYIVVPSVENDEKQSPVRAQYQLTNDAEPDKNVTVWTDIPEDHTISVNEGTNRIALRTTDLSGNTGNESIYTINRDNTQPHFIGFSPANGASEVGAVPTISFTADEPLMKGKGYITIYNKSKNLTVLDLHSSNNRVKLSNENRTVTITLPAALEADTEYELLMDEGFVSDRAGNQGPAIAAESSWCFATADATAIPDEEIVVLGYTVELISKSGPDGQETIQTVTAPADREAERQHNIVAKASYSINGTDYYVKLRVRPFMNAEPELINVSVSEGTATLSDDKQCIDVLIPQSAGEALMTISLGSGTANQFSIKIINSGYTALVETSGGINATADEGNLLNSVDLSEEVETGQLPDTSVDVTVKLAIAEKTETDIPDLEEIQQTVPGAALRFLSITMEKIVKTTIEGSGSSTETTSITATQQPVVIIIDIPEEIQGQFIYKIVREHNGIRDILSAEVIDNGTRLRFETDRFSTYTIAAAAAPRHGNNKKESIKPVSVTADSKRMTVELDKLAIEENIEKNALLPYFIESEEELIVPFSIVQNGEIKWIAEQGQTYWFKSNQKQFEDIYDHWAEEDILFCSVRDLFDGTGTKQFSADKGMTRGMYVTVLGRLWKVDAGQFGTSHFDDVRSSDWYAPYIDWAVQAGIIEGFGNELFQPNQVLSREQMALITARFIKYAQLELKPVNGAEMPADRFAVSEWAADEAWLMLETGLIKGKPHNLFDPQGNVTRGEAAAVIKRLIENTVQ